MTLVDVATVLAVLRQHVTVRALANEAADRVPTSAVAAQKRHNSTFVNIRTVVIRTELESLVALTLVGAQGVDASAIIAYVRIALAFVDVDAIVSVASQREPGVADALETALQITARAVAADARSLVTFVDVDAIVLARSKLVASRTLAHEVALFVNALCVPAAGIRYLLTLVLVNALVRVLVINETAVALTLKTAGRIHATAVSAHRRHQGALVNLLGVICDRVHDLAWHQSAENLVFAGPFARTFLAETAPRGSHGTAAQHLCLWLHHGIKALSRIVSEVAGFLSHVHALLSSGHRHVSFRALAMVFPLIIDAISYAAYSWMQRALVYVDATGFRTVQDEAFVAGAHKTTERVGAVPVLADILVLFTLIDVFQNDRHAIRPVPWSAGAQLIVLFRVDLRTFLATIAPRGADAAATRCLRH